MRGEGYGDASYWDKRYAKEEEEEAFDWYQKYPAVSALLHLYIPPNSPQPTILVVGCGNSAFSEGMINDGYGDVVNIDISPVVIRAMHRKYTNRPQLKYLTMDVRDMSAFQAASFDAVIDKGTLDSLLCGSDSRVNARMMLEEVGRVLKDKGVYILITYGAPNYRLPLLRESVPWTIKLHVIGKSLGDESSEHEKWELTTPVPLDGDGSSMEAALGMNTSVHYIYVCTKDDASRSELEHEEPIE